MFKRKRPYRACRGNKLSKSLISAGNIKSHFGHSFYYGKNWHQPWRPDWQSRWGRGRKADAGFEGMSFVGQPGLEGCHVSWMRMTLPQGHAVDTQADGDRGCEEEASEQPQSIISGTLYCIQNARYRRGGWILPLSSAAGTKPRWEMSWQKMQAWMPLQKRSSMQASGDARPRRGEQSWQRQALNIN